jgi:WD40 repeat protein
VYCEKTELLSVHREGISAFDMSDNGKYTLTAGDDKLIKLWDSKAQHNDPRFYQTFIGHTFPVENAFFKPGDN